MLYVINKIKNLTSKIKKNHTNKYIKIILRLLEKWYHDYTYARKVRKMICNRMADKIEDSNAFVPVASFAAPFDVLRTTHSGWIFISRNVVIPIIDADAAFDVSQV